MAESVDFSVIAPPDYLETFGAQVPAACITWPAQRVLSDGTHREGGEVTPAVDASINAAKAPQPVAVHPASLGDLTCRDVLIVDDVANTGDRFAATARMAADSGAGRVRTLVCVVDEDNWTGGLPAEAAVTYIGTITRGWVVFPGRATMSTSTEQLPEQFRTRFGTVSVPKRATKLLYVCGRPA
jgi:hypothetical protein